MGCCELGTAYILDTMGILPSPMFYTNMVCLQMGLLSPALITEPACSRLVPAFPCCQVFVCITAFRVMMQDVFTCFITVLSSDSNRQCFSLLQIKSAAYRTALSTFLFSIIAALRSQSRQIIKARVRHRKCLGLSRIRNGCVQQVRCQGILRAVKLAEIHPVHALIQLINLVFPVILPPGQIDCPFSPVGSVIIHGI